MADLADTLVKAWYQRRRWLWLLWPLSLLFGVISNARRRAYQRGWLHAQQVTAPVIVVGNITVGGVGKTPLVAWLVKHLQAQGYRPGVVSRGYGGRAATYPYAVTEHSDASVCGDEPLMLQRQLQVPVVVDPRRARGAQHLVDAHGCDVMVADDGLQHYGLKRDLEIVVIDQQRQLGNGWLLPAGPLREPAARLNRVDWVIENGPQPAHSSEHFSMHLAITGFVNLASAEVRPVDAFAGITWDAVAAIGHPERFFQALEALGLSIRRHAFADHHRFTRADFAFAADRPILMTEKDAVKCGTLGLPQVWYSQTELQVDTAFVEAFDARLTTLKMRET